jgi:patatin-related protein
MDLLGHGRIFSHRLKWRRARATLGANVRSELRPAPSNGGLVLAQQNGNETAKPRRELRLAIVCYGGVSLCVYMHGTTKEIHRLVKASRLLAAGGDETGASTPSERVYHDLLTQAAGPDGVRTEVVVDVVAGTSAGGINGIFLAKALAHNLSQDLLRDLWFDKGDIKKLLRGPARLPIWMKAPFLLARGIKKAPLRGKDMSIWLYDALRGMDDSRAAPPAPQTLMPDGHLLQLFVTMTDFYGYDRQISIADPKLAHDRRHRHVFEFRYGDGPDLFGSDRNLALAFAARTTSCFPGAFPPVSIPVFKGYLPNAPGDLRDPFFRLYEVSGADVERTYFVDGGVLDNRPFGYVIDAIRQKRAEVEVDRRMLYLEPDPGGAAAAAPAKEPETIAAVLGAVSGIPRREPILDDLLEVARLNERVRRIQDVVILSFDKIAEQTAAILGGALTPDAPPDADAVASLNTELSEAARKDAGMAYVTYVRSKISGAVDRLGTTACNVCDYPVDANHAFLVRSVFRCWAEQEGLFEQSAEPTDSQIRFLQTFDLDYGVRRLQFVLAGVNAWYDRVGEVEHPSREQLDAVKARLWQAVVHLRDAMSGDRFTPELTKSLGACFPVKDIADFLAEAGFEPKRYVERREQELDALVRDISTFLEGELRDFNKALYTDMERLTDGWDWARRQDILVRFLGFPFWDILLFPIQSVAGAGERDSVEVIRMSPRDAHLLHVPGGGPKLDGLGFAHFRGFFKRQYRENDYLWGRLDAAERMIGIVLGPDHPEFRVWCGRAFAAILDEEEPALGLVRPLVQHVRHQAHALAKTEHPDLAGRPPAEPVPARSEHSAAS